MTRKWVIAITAGAAMATGALLSASDHGRDDATIAVSGVEAATPVSVSPGGAARPLELRPGSRRLVGRFEAHGRTLRLETAEMVAGGACLLHEDGTGVSGSQCFEGGLFGASRAAFSLNFDGGPARFSEMYVIGVVAPAIGKVALVRSDGSAVDAQPNRDGAFLVESSPAELERGVLPKSLKLYARNGRLAETVEIPPPG